MTLYGPVERFFLDTFSPEVLVCERHPLIETFVYGPLYVLLAGSGWDGSALEPTIRSVVDRSDGEVFKAVRAGMRRRQNASATRSASGSDSPTWPAPFRASLKRRSRTSPGAIGRHCPMSCSGLMSHRSRRLADARHATRQGWSKPMRLRLLGILRQGYLQFRESISHVFPEISVHVVDTSDGVDIDSSVQACVAEGRLFA